MKEQTPFESDFFPKLNTGVPPRLTEVDPSALPRLITDPRLLTIARSWGGDSGRLVLGPTGIGKSLSFAQAARRFDVGRKSGLNTPELFWLRADELSHGRSETIEQAKRADVIVIDSLGWEQPGSSRGICEIIGARYDAGLVTVATSGLTCTMFLDRYGDAIVRRLVEVGGGELVDGWDDGPGLDTLDEND